VHTYFFSTICNEHWVLISFGDICLSAYPLSCGYTLTIPPPHTLPYYLQTKYPSCRLSHKTVGGGLPPSERGVKTYDWCAATLFVFVLITTCTMVCQLDKISHLTSHPHNTSAATTLHSHLLPTHTPAPHTHLYFGYKSACPGRTPGLVPTVVAKDSATLHTPTRLGKVYKRALVVPPSSPHQSVRLWGMFIF